MTRLIDANGDGAFEDHAVVARREGMHGIAFDGDAAYLATVEGVLTAPVSPDGSFGEQEVIIDDLPDSGQHPNRTPAIGPDGMLYVSVGPTCNACAESSPESAAMLRGPADGSARTVFASGLRIEEGRQYGWPYVYGFDELNPQDNPPSGYEVARVDFEGGEPVSFEPWATGFLVESEGPRCGFLGRLVGLALTPQGDLLLGDAAQGILHRISPEA